MNIAVVTGAGSGLGKSIALALSKKSYTVYGTAFTQNEIVELDHLSDGKVILKICDITQENQIEDFVNFVQEQSKMQVDLLINNAGILTPGPIEVLALDVIIKEFDVNTFGLIRIVNGFLPALRQTKGRIIQVSTLSVDQPSPFNAPSSASKSAAEVFTELYAVELKKMGITTSIAVCGNMKTGGPAKVKHALDKVLTEMNADMLEIYGKEFEAFSERIMVGQNNGVDANIAADEIVSLAQQKNPPLRMPIGDDARKILSLSKT